MHISKSKTLFVFLLCTMLVGCKQELSASKAIQPDAPKVAANFDTPEGALQKIEAAYLAKDLEEVVRCKGFEQEAKLMLANSKFKLTEPDADLLKETAETLEMVFRAEIKQNGFPVMDGIRCQATNREPYADQVVVITEVCKYPDGGTSTQKVLVAQTANGWRVLNPLSN